MAQANQALQWHRPHSRYGSDGNDLAAHHHSILQWSQEAARSLYAHLRLRLQEGVLLSK